MKKLLLALLVLASLASCGKKNSVGSENTYATSPLTSTIVGAGTLSSMINNYSSQFGVAQMLYYGNSMTWGQLSNQGLNMGYHYTKSTSTASGSSCERKWGIFYVCSYSSSSSSVSGVVESKKTNNNSVDVLSKQNELIGYINNSISIQQQGSSYMIYLKDGRKVVIDPRYPLQAQPIGIQDSTNTEYLYNITEN